MSVPNERWAKRDLQPGARYRIELSDCCIQGTLEGTFLELTDPDEDGEYGYARFDFGTLGPDWGQWDAERIDG